MQFELIPEDPNPIPTLSLDTLTSAQGMDSRDIAERTGKSHAHVCRDILEMLQQLGEPESRFGSGYMDAQGQRRRCFLLPKRESLILASGYSIPLRAKIIDRWAELEARALQPFQIPTTLADALQLAADQARQIDTQAAALAIAAPKVAAQDLLSGAGGLFGIREAGKQCGMGQKAFTAFLVDRKIMYRLGGDLTPHQEHIDAGRFAVSTGTAIHGEDAHAWRQAKFTARGIAWIAERVAGK